MKLESVGPRLRDVFMVGGIILSRTGGMVARTAAGGWTVDVPCRPTMTSTPITHLDSPSRHRPCLPRVQAFVTPCSGLSLLFLHHAPPNLLSLTSVLITPRHPLASPSRSICQSNYHPFATHTA